MPARRQKRREREPAIGFGGQNLINSRYPLIVGGHGDVGCFHVERDGLALLGVDDVEYILPSFAVRYQMGNPALRVAI